MKLSSYFTDVAKGTTRSTTSWTWPPFKPRKTISRTAKYDTLKNVKSVKCDTGKSAAVQKDSVGEMATKALESKRLIFQPDNTGSILEVAKYQFKDCVTLTIDSENPYWDFRNSMEEMVEAYGLKRWKHLEELLASYLRLNRKNNHGLINIKAFSDIFAGIFTVSSPLSNSVASSSSKNKRLAGDRQ